MEALLNSINQMSITTTILTIVGIYFILVFISDYRHLKAKKIPTFSAEPPYNYKTITDGEITVEANSYQEAYFLLSQKAFKIGADGVKDFKIVTFKKRMNDENDSFILSGLLVKNIN